MKRIIAHDMLGRSAQLSYYFLLALFPLLIFVSAIVGNLFAQERDVYFRNGVISAKRHPNFGFRIAVRHAPGNHPRGSWGEGDIRTGVQPLDRLFRNGAIIEGLNVAYDVSEARAWWRRRLVAIALTVCLGVLVAATVFLILASNGMADAIGAYVPAFAQIGRLSTAVQWFVGILFLLLVLLDHKIGGLDSRVS